MIVLFDPRHITPPIGLSWVFPVTYSPSVHLQTIKCLSDPDQFSNKDKCL
ncbi:uncharacterized protein METZ01_LOCUS318356, partial [marine metagenome]